MNMIAFFGVFVCASSIGYVIGVQHGIKQGVDKTLDMLRGPM
jgi:hypothetical protein